MKLVNIEVIKSELERLIRNYRFYSSTEAKYRYEAYKELSEWLDSIEVKDNGTVWHSFDSHIQEGDKITVNEDGSRFNRSQLERVIAKQEEPVSEELDDLEKAALLYYNDVVWSKQLGKKDEMYHFKAGAKWMKQQMMKDAIEREVKVDAGGYPYIDSTELYDYDNDKPLAKAGDKVKVMFIKD